jgi:hypothetical protein
MATNFIPDNTKELHKYITIEFEGPIRELNNKLGPVLNPIWVPLRTVRLLVAHNYKVYEHPINEPEKKVELNLQNWDDANIYPDNALIQDPAIPENTLLVQFKDDVNNDVITTTGNIYVEILD